MQGFWLHKRIIIIMEIRTRCSCKRLRNNLDILPVPCLYIYLIMVVVKNHENFQTNSSLHCINTRKKIKYIALQQIFHLLKYSCIKIFNSLVSNTLKLQNNTSNFKVAYFLFSWGFFLSQPRCPNILMNDTESIVTWFLNIQYINSDCIL